MAEEERLTKINIEDEMKSAYIDYSMSVIVSRALPDVRDGLKPVQRRVLFGMSELGLYHNKPYKKSARIVGEVLGKYHPHGDSSVYESMVRMAQPWSLRYPLVDGQGNFGSMDGDGPAAMRYTEARLQKISAETLKDIDKETVDFQLNFDDTLKEPTVMPTRIPNLLINGASGIAVGMATNMPPHNLSNTIDAIIKYIDNPEVSIDELADIIQAPDFPTGGIIYGMQGVKDAYRTGRGRVVLRGKATIETDKNGKEKIVVTEVPYLVNKAEMIRKTADLINDKKIEGVANVNDESDREGTRIVYELKRDAVANIVLNKLYKQTQLQTSFGVNNIALVKGRPKLLNLKDLIEKFVEHRHEVVVRRTEYELRQAEERAHILEGLLIALDHLDEVITLIRNSDTPETARNELMSKYELTEVQARAILDMRLQKLTGLERNKVKEEHAELLKQINYLKSVLEDEGLRYKIIKEELIELKEQYDEGRRTAIEYEAGEFNPEDFYADEDMVVTISHMGYIKRTPVTEYKKQGRGGIGVKGSNTRDQDFLEHMFIASMHNTILFFTEIGRCYWLKVYNIPEGSKSSKGRAIQNLINIAPEDRVKTHINVKTLEEEDYVRNNYILLCTKRGIIKKTSLEAYSRPRQNGVNAITIREGDQLIEARLTTGESDIILASKEGKAIRFNEKNVRAVGRVAAGVRGMTLASEDDEVVGMVCIEEGEENILVVSEKGYGKRSRLEDYRITNRGGKGVKTLNITKRTGRLIAIKGVADKNDLMIINRSGMTIRLAVSAIRVTGRAAQGVKLLNLRNGDSIAAVSQIYVEENDDEQLEQNENNGDSNSDTNEQQHQG
ncbi:MAG: DNA gyrase subunit A [Bacteroidales bacterium]